MLRYIHVVILLAERYVKYSHVINLVAEGYVKKYSLDRLTVFQE
jgi:hypothetical protein